MKMKLYTVVAILMIVMITMSAALAATGDMMPAGMPQDLLLTKGTIIKIQAVDKISSQKNKHNEIVHFRVKENITVGDVTIVPANTVVEGVITKVKKAGRWGKDGQIAVEFSEVKTKGGHSIPVAGLLEIRGDKQNILVKYSLGGVLIKGKEAVIKTGVEVNLQVKENVMIGSDGNV